MTQLLNGKFQIPLWDLSEVFNTHLQTVERFGKGKAQNSKPYPGLVNQIEIFGKIWEEAEEDIDLFFSKLEVNLT